MTFVIIAFSVVVALLLLLSFTRTPKTTTTRHRFVAENNCWKLHASHANGIKEERLEQRYICLNHEGCEEWRYRNKTRFVRNGVMISTRDDNDYGI